MSPTIPNHSINPITITDLPPLSKLLHTSKLSLTINRLLFKDWPNDAIQIPIYTRAIQGGFEDPNVECLKVTNNMSSEIIGLLVLSRKRPESTEGKRGEKGDDEEKSVRDGSESGDDGIKETLNIPEGMNPDIYTWVQHAGTELNKEMKGIDHFELTYICVKLGSRRQGIGSELVRICFERAREEGIPLVVSSEPAAWDFFVGLGFRDVKHVDVDLSVWAPKFSGFGVFRLAGMIWMP